MDFATEDLPTDYNQLLVLTRLLIAELKDTKALVLILRGQIAKLERIAFGRRSEKVTLDLAQLRLLLGDLEGPSLRDDHALAQEASADVEAKIATGCTWSSGRFSRICGQDQQLRATNHGNKYGR